LAAARRVPVAAPSTEDADVEEQPVTQSNRLTRDEDHQLRLLTFFEHLGVRLAPEFKDLKMQLRARDHRHAVRDPEIDRVTPAV
jgi:hypothetical protein